MSIHFSLNLSRCLKIFKYLFIEFNRFSIDVLKISQISIQIFTGLSSFQIKIRIQTLNQTGSKCDRVASAAWCASRGESMLFREQRPETSSHTTLGELISDRRPLCTLATCIESSARYIYGTWQYVGFNIKFCQFVIRGLFMVVAPFVFNSKNPTI